MAATTATTTPVPVPAWDSTEARLMVALCLRSFDFKRVALMMAAVGWKWRGAKESPTPDEIEASAVSLLGHAHAAAVQSGRSMFVSSGGLEAAWHRCDNPDWPVAWWPELSFVGESAEGYVGAAE